MSLFPNHHPSGGMVHGIDVLGIHLFHALSKLPPAHQNVQEFKKFHHLYRQKQHTRRILSKILTQGKTCAGFLKIKKRHYLNEENQRSEIPHQIQNYKGSRYQGPEKFPQGWKTFITRTIGSGRTTNLKHVWWNQQCVWGFPPLAFFSESNS